MPTEAVGTAPLVLSDWDALASPVCLGAADNDCSIPPGDAGGDGTADSISTVATGDLERPFHVGEHIAQLSEPTIDYSREHSLAEIAEATGLSVGRVSIVIEKAQKKLRIMLERRGYGLEDCFDNRIEPGVIYNTRRPASRPRSE